MQISRTVLCRLPIHKASINWFVTHLLFLNYLVNAVKHSSLKSSSVKRYQPTNRRTFELPGTVRTMYGRTMAQISLKMAKSPKSAGVLKWPELCQFWSN